MVSGSGSTSVLVFRGVEDLGGGLKASFWIESTLFADTGGAGGVTLTPANQFWDRRATVSLSGPFGEVRMGRDWTPVFLGHVSATRLFSWAWAAWATFSTARCRRLWARRSAAR